MKRNYVLWVKEAKKDNIKAPQKKTKNYKWDQGMQTLTKKGGNGNKREKFRKKKKEYWSNKQKARENI